LYVSADVHGSIDAKWRLAIIFEKGLLNVERDIERSRVHYTALINHYPAGSEKRILASRYLVRLDSEPGGDYDAEGEEAE
jgi:TPR repeat protein